MTFSLAPTPRSKRAVLHLQLGFLLLLLCLAALLFLLCASKPSLSLQDHVLLWNNNDDDDTSMMLDFDAWTALHGRVYDSTAERSKRRQVYLQNVSRWQQLNNAEAAGIGAKYGPEHEPYADVSPEEFAQIVARGCVGDGNDARRYDTPHHNKQDTPALTPPPLKVAFTRYIVDWRLHRKDNKSYVTPVKSQGPFGTCWSFGVAENLEGLAVRQGFALQNISEQEFISCCDSCQGRSADVSFEWLLNHTDGKPALEESFPYQGNTSAPCLAATAPRAPVTLHSWGRVADDGTGKPIRKALQIRGPMGMGIDASCFHGYVGGIVRNCTSQGINHAVLMVAAGVEYYWHHGKLERVPFFTIKNSWSPHWGEAGFGRFEMGHEWWGKLNLIYTE